MIRVAHPIDRHDIRALPQRLQPHIFLDFVDDVLQPFVASERYIENIRDHLSTPRLIVLASGFKQARENMSHSSKKIGARD
jgi:hypothetical protein